MPVYAVIIALVWLISAIVKKLTSDDSRSKQAEPWLNNFMIRFLYEVFFELAICAMINISNQQAGGMVQWLISFTVIVMISVTLVVVMTLFCKNGPYIKDTYAPGSVLDSFWGRRMLHDDVTQAAVAEEELTSRMDTVRKSVD